MQVLSFWVASNSDYLMDILVRSIRSRVSSDDVCDIPKCYPVCCTCTCFKCIPRNSFSFGIPQTSNEQWKQFWISNLWRIARLWPWKLVRQCFSTMRRRKISEGGQMDIKSLHGALSIRLFFSTSTQTIIYSCQSQKLFIIQPSVLGTPSSNHGLGIYH